jgi:quercetin dioxygenase-like cupin family protein
MVRPPPAACDRSLGSVPVGAVWGRTIRGMVQPGDVIENPKTGERIRFVRTSDQTGGAVAEMELALSPTAHLPADHIHLRQEEKFEVIEGRIRVRCRGQESLRGPGELVVVPPGAPHGWAPDGGEGAVVLLTFSPGAGIEEFFDEYFRCAREGRTNAKGMPPLDVSARLALAHDMYLPRAPIPLQRAAFRIVVGATRRLHRSPGG